MGGTQGPQRGELTAVRPAAVSSEPSQRRCSAGPQALSLGKVWASVLPFCPCGRGFSSDSYTLAR